MIAAGAPAARGRLARWDRVTLSALLLPLVISQDPMLYLLRVPESSLVWSALPTALSVAIAIIVAARHAVRRRSLLPGTFLDVPVLAVAGSVVIGTLVALLRRNSPVYILTDLFHVTEFIAVFAAAATLLRSRDDAKLMLKAIGLLAALGAAADLVAVGVGALPPEVTAHAPPPVSAIAQRSSGPAQPPVSPICNYGYRYDPAAGCVSVASGPALPALDFSAEDPGRLVDELAGLAVGGFWALLLFARRQRALAALGMALTTVATVTGLTRGLWLASGVGCALILAVVPGWRRRAAAAGVGVAAAVLLLGGASLVHSVFGAPDPGAALLDRIRYTGEQLFHPINQVQERRVIETSDVLTLAVHSPVFGYGLGAQYIGPTGYTPLDTTIGERHFVHDGYLAILLRLGLLGLVAYGWLAVRFLARALAYARASMPRTDAVAVTAVVAGFAGLLVFSVTSDYLMRHPMAVPLAISMAAVSTLVSANGGA